MTGLAVLIPIAVAMGLFALLGFFWALRSGQYEDLEGASQRILDEAPPDEAQPVRERNSARSRITTQR